MENGEYIVNIIAKQLSGEATEPELAVLEVWRNEKETNKKEYDNLVKIWEEMDKIFPAKSFNTAKAWKKVDTTLQLKEDSPKTTPSVPVALFRNPFTIAAAAAVLLLVALFAWNGNRQQWQTVAAVKSNKLINLPDNSSILLRKGSSITYPASFKGNERTVTLSGEAFFNVYHNNQQPFVITTANSKIRVLGTSFLVVTKASTDKIVVVTGKVSVTDKQKADNKVLLVAGQKVILSNQAFLQSNVNDSNDIAWKSGVLEFKEAPLAKVLEDIADYYEVPVAISNNHNPSLDSIHLTVRFQQQSLSQVLEEIRLITGLDIKNEDNKTIFYRK